MNLANALTVFRIITLPFIIYFIYQEKLLFSFLALLFFTLSVFSDYLDGVVARKTRTITDVGSFLDPLSDKIVVTGLLLVFLVRGSFWLFPLAIFIFRDFVVNGIRSMAARKELVIAADIFGKLKTNFQFLLIYGLMIKDFLLYDNLQNSFWMVSINGLILFFTVISVLLSLFSMFNYIYQYWNKSRPATKGKEIKEEKLVILANRRSRGFRDRYRRRLLKKFSKRRNAPIIYLPNKKQMYKDVEKKIANYDHIIIAGGDGSFEGALNYPPFKNKSLGFFPLGAGNAFYSYFYKGKRFQYLRSQFLFKEIEMDVLELNWDKGQDETLFMGVGIDSEVARIGSKKRTQHGFLDYLRGAVKALFEAKASYDLRCQVDEKEYHWENCVNLVLGKVPYYGYGVRSLLFPLDPNDGYVYALACINTHSVFLNKAIRLLAIIITGLNLHRAPLLALKGKEFILESEEPFPIQAGGEFLGYTRKVAVKVKRKQKILVI